MLLMLLLAVHTMLWLLLLLLLVVVLLGCTVNAVSRPRRWYFVDMVVRSHGGAKKYFSPSSLSLSRPLLIVVWLCLLMRWWVGGLAWSGSAAGLALSDTERG